jgi:hypothetical protein
MGNRTVYIVIACILAVIIPLLPKLVQLRVWILRKVHLFRLADWLELNSVRLVTISRVVLTVAIVILLLLTLWMT